LIGVRIADQLETGMIRKIAIVCVLMALGGCSYGIKSGQKYTSEKVGVQMNYEAAFRLADAQARECAKNATVAGNVYSDNHTGIVRATLPPYSEGDALRVELSSRGPGSTDVTITVMDAGMYDAAMVDAVKNTMVTGKILCRDGSYWNTHRIQ
jgi:hypothetical protein